MVHRVWLVLPLLILIACSKAPSGDVAAGKAKFDQNCALCHGPEGKGDGPGSKGLNPQPRNFHDAAYMSGRTDEQLHKVIKEGGAANGFSPVMPPWGGTLSDQDINNVIAYIRTFSK
jgi:mono/diheme cytochrome c family protein